MATTDNWKCNFCDHRHVTRPGGFGGHVCAHCGAPRYCQSRTAAALASGNWGDSRLTCAKRAKHKIEGQHLCGLHAEKGAL